MNPMKTIQPYLEQFILGKDRNWVKLIETAVKDTALSTITIPADLRSFLNKANHGELEVKVKGLTESPKLVYALGHQLLYGLFIMFFGGFGYFTYSNGEITLSKALFGISAFFLLSLGFSFLRARKWQKKGH